VLIIDASVAAQWFIVETDRRYAAAVLDEVERRGAIVPALFLWEMQSVLLKAERRNVVTPNEVDEALDLLRRLPILIESVQSSLGRSNEVVLSRHYGLAPYDAAYLALALRRRGMLATDDTKLTAAAADLGILYE
jgi:predicted nucleic acid-binding protein